MMRSLNSEFEVSDSLQIDETINLEQALAKLESGNIQLKLLQLLENNGSMKLRNSNRMPIQESISMQVIIL